MRASLLSLCFLSVLAGHDSLRADEPAGVLVERVEFQVAIEAEGVVEPADRAVLRSPADRELTLMEIAEEGELVQTGERVARLDDSALREDWEKQRIELDYAERRLLAARMERELVQLRHLRAERALDARALELAGERRQAEQELARAKNGAAPLDRAEARMAVAKAHAEVLALDRKILVMESERAREVAEGGLKRAEDELTRQRRMYRRRDEQIAGCELRATRDGMVIHASRRGGRVQIGDPIAARQAVLEIVDPRNVRARIEVADADVSAIGPGLRTMLRLAGGREAIAGVVESVGRTPILPRWDKRDAGTRYAVLVALPEPGEDVRIGMRLGARILVKTLPDALVVPNAAIQSDGKRAWCVVVTESKTEIREVLLGPSGPTHTVVKRGVAEGERVIAD